MAQHRPDVVYYRLGFGNVVNNYANQVSVIPPVFIFALYFIPYDNRRATGAQPSKREKGASVPGLSIRWAGLPLRSMDLRKSHGCLTRRKSRRRYYVLGWL